MEELGRGTGEQWKHVDVPMSSDGLVTVGELIEALEQFPKDGAIRFSKTAIAAIKDDDPDGRTSFIRIPVRTKIGGSVG